MKHVLALFLIVLFISCNNNVKDKENNDDTIISTPEKPVSEMQGCYMKITGQDTAILMLEQNGNELTGKMLFDNYQKDGSRGTVSGKIEGETIRLWYDFFAEGMHSMMEIYFKKENNNLIRGIGTVDVKGDTAYYKDTTDIAYPPGEAFEKTDCTVLKEKLNFN